MKRFLLCFFVSWIVLDVYPEDIKLRGRGVFLPGVKSEGKKRGKFDFWLWS